MIEPHSRRPRVLLQTIRGDVVQKVYPQAGTRETT
jgi:hypothetical protein